MKKNLIIFAILITLISFTFYFSCPIKASDDDDNGGSTTSSLSSSAGSSSSSSSSSSTSSTGSSSSAGGTVADPVISFAPDTPSSGWLTVTITCSTPDAVIYYKREVTNNPSASTDIDDPKNGGSTYSIPYQEGMVGGAGMTFYNHVKAIATKGGMTDSSIIYSYEWCYTDFYGSTTWGP